MLRGCCDALLQQLQQKMSRETGKSKKKTVGNSNGIYNFRVM